MASTDAFLNTDRELPEPRDPKERINDSQEIYLEFEEGKTVRQASRCMDCGVPFCHKGCPLGNYIPDFNDAVYRKNWKEAYEILDSTNNFPEFTGRICPAPCEASCVLAINKPAVTIEHIEKSIIEKAFDKGWVKPRPPKQRTGKKIAVIGSGPAGLAAAVQLNKAGHSVTVFEKSDRIGGLLRYGIPDFKLEKWTVDRRIQIMQKEGIEFRVNTEIGSKKFPAEKLQHQYDAIVLTIGSQVPRDLPIPGRNLKGIHFAMEFLTQQNRRVAGDEQIGEQISAKDKHVVVLGGGDTGSDCVGTSNRQKAASVTQIELMDRPPEARRDFNPWPEWPMTLRTSSSHEEGCDRNWSILTKAFLSDEEGNVKGLKVVDIEWKNHEDKPFREIEGSERTIPCDLALLAIGYVHPTKDGLVNELGLELDKRGNIKTVSWETNIPNIFAAGDAYRGQSLVVWAISDGREAARAVDLYLMGYSRLESKEIIALEGAMV